MKRFSDKWNRLVTSNGVVDHVSVDHSAIGKEDVLNTDYYFIKT